LLVYQLPVKSELAGESLVEEGFLEFVEGGEFALQPISESGLESSSRPATRPHALNASKHPAEA
jgi:hypothetical protein